MCDSSVHPWVWTVRGKSRGRDRNAPAQSVSVEGNQRNQSTHDTPIINVGPVFRLLWHLCSSSGLQFAVQPLKTVQPLWQYNFQTCVLHLRPAGERILFLQQHPLYHLPVLRADGAVQLPGLHNRETDRVNTSARQSAEGLPAPWGHTSIPALLFHADWTNCSWTKPPPSSSLHRREKKLPLTQHVRGRGGTQDCEPHLQPALSVGLKTTTRSPETSADYSTQDQNVNSSETVNTLT